MCVYVRVCQSVRRGGREGGRGGGDEEKSVGMLMRVKSFMVQIFGTFEQTDRQTD
jgi:hypothetical protein